MSNFEVCDIFYLGHKFTSTEAAYQAAKCLNLEDVEKFIDIKPADAKKLGMMVLLRPDWEEVKLTVMEDVTRIKFKIPRLRQMLLDTNNSILQEGNNWGDTYWGICDGKGFNYLGKIIMKIRQEIRDELSVK